MKIYDIKKEDWVFFYRMQGLPYLIADIWVKTYGGILGLHDGKTHLGFIHKDYEEQALKTGYELFTNNEKFHHFQQEYQDVISKVPAFVKRFREEEISAKFWEEYVEFTKELARFYEKMEWYYTDLLYQLKADPKRVRQVEELKQAGRDAANKMTLDDDSFYFIEQIAKKLDTNVEAIYRSSINAIKDALEGSKFADAIEREKGFGLLWNGKGYDDLSWQEAAKIRQLLESEDDKDVAEIKGTIANKGIVRGKASVIPNLYDELDKLYELMDKMPKGNILVASTTSPEFTPALKKAAAIVTNEGGLGSHAAIVSREFKIPCIVGTKNATEIIKDGDIIEVDADNGIVRIIK